MINYSQNNNSNSNTYHKNNNNYRKNVKYNRNIIPWMRKNTFSDDKKTLMEKLDQEIKDFVDYIKSTDEEKKMRDYVIEKLNNVVTKIWPDAKICVYGSFPLDLYLPVSDIDIVINGGNKYTDGPIYKLADELEKNNFFENMDVIATAKIPIIKVSEKISRCNVDITFDHNINFEKMRDLVVQYNNEFPELKPLLLILKYVLYQRNLNIPFQGGIGSFALLVLIRHFLCYYLGKRGFGPMAKHYKENNEDNEEYESSHEDENQPFGINNQDKPNSRMQNTSKKNGLNGHSKTIPTDGFPPTSIKNGSKQKKKNKKKNGANNTDSNQSGDFQKKTPEEGMNGVDSNKSKYAIGSPHSTSSHIKVVPKNSSNKTDVHVKLNGHSQSHNIKNNNTTSSFNSNNKQNQSFKEKLFHNPEISSNGFHENNKSENQKEKNKKRKLKRPNLGELLVNFFKYFGEFNFVSNGVSADGTFSKEERGFIDQQIPWKLYVDDPINPSNNLGSATYHVLTIRDFFKDCHEVLTDENASSNTILTRIIILDPHLDKHRSYTYHNFNEKIQSYNNSNSNTNSNNYRYNNYNNNNHGNSHHHSNSHGSNGSYHNHNNYNNGNSYYNRNHNNQKATNGQY